MAHDHPDPDDPRWDDPDFCPFCGERLADPGSGFVDHIETSATCADRFADWRENVVNDIGGEWGG